MYITPLACMYAARLSVLLYDSTRVGLMFPTAMEKLEVLFYRCAGFCWVLWVRAKAQGPWGRSARGAVPWALALEVCIDQYFAVCLSLSDFRSSACAPFFVCFPPVGDSEPLCPCCCRVHSMTLRELHAGPRSAAG